MPPNIAFDLIGDAFKPKTEAEESWMQLTDDLNARLHSSRQAVMKATDVSKEAVMKICFQFILWPLLF